MKCLICNTETQGKILCSKECEKDYLFKTRQYNKERRKYMQDYIDQLVDIESTERYISKI